MVKRTTKKPSLTFSIFVIVSMIALISVGMLVFGASIQIMMFTALIAVMLLMTRLGYSFQEVEKSAFQSMLKALQPGLIISTVGILIGAWMISGTVPSIIYYGIQAISPPFFLLITLVLCTVVSLSTGASWATIGTAGIAMMGVGHSLDVPTGMTAGAIISGAFFGDKVSPLSDSTNLMSAIVGTDLMYHIKHMLWTTGPAYMISAIIFTVLGFMYSSTSMNSDKVSQLTDYLQESFHMGWIPFIPALVIIGLLVMKQPPIPSIFMGALTAGAVAIFYQGASVQEITEVFYNGYSESSGIDIVDNLLQQGGLTSMLPLLALFLFALGLGGLLYDYGILSVILEKSVDRIKHQGLLVAVAMLTSYIMLAIGGSASFSGVMTGTMLQPEFDKFNLRPENLSRLIEDTATQSTALLPWTAGGLFTISALGVSPLVYIPFCLLALITPLFTLFYGVTGFTMAKKQSE